MARTTADEPTEARLVEVYRASADGEVFEDLYRLARRKVLGVCVKILGDLGRAEEACQEAFVRAYDRFDTLRGANFSGWVCRIAANHCYDELSRRAREVSANPRRESDPDADPFEHRSLAAPDNPVERETLSREALGRALKILEALEPHQRTVFLLRHLDGMSYPEIGAKTGYTYKQVKSYLQNARRNFQLGWERQDREAGRTR